MTIARCDWFNSHASNALERFDSIFPLAAMEKDCEEDEEEVDERMRAAKLSVVSFRHRSLWISSPASFKNSDKSSTDSNSTAVSLSLSKGTKPKYEK